MNIYDEANKFAKALRENEDVVKFRELTLKVNEDKETQEILQGFREIQIEAYTQVNEKGEVSEETKKKMEEFGKVIEENDFVNEYLQAESRFSILIEDVMKLINEAIGVDIIGPGA